MKKRVFFIAALAAAIFTSNDLVAQDGGMKPAGGEKNVEVNFTPLGGTPISINNIRFRYFKSSDMAIRVGFNLVSATTTDVNLGGGTDGSGELETKDNEFGFGLNVGIEKHFAGSDRLSPYWGAELGFALVNTTNTEELNDGSGGTYESETTGGETTFGLNLILGADYYFSNHIYMGTEIGFGFATTSEQDGEQTNPAGDGSPTAKTPGGSSFNVGPNFNSAIRLGYLF